MTTNKIKDWEKELDKLPQTGMTTKQFISQTLSRQKQEILELILKWAEEELKDERCNADEAFALQNKALRNGRKGAFNDLLSKLKNL